VSPPISSFSATRGRFAGTGLHVTVVVAIVLMALAGHAGARLFLEPPSAWARSRGSETAPSLGDGSRAARDTGKVVIIGLDGATWRVIEPMMQRGELPHLERLVRDGTSGRLMSFEPIESPRVWTRWVVLLPPASQPGMTKPSSSCGG
jgi:hypothetical protein